MDKYEYLAGEDLKATPTVTEKAWFEASQMCRTFNNEMNKEDKKEGLLKRLKNIEDKSGKQLKAIEDQEEKTNTHTRYKIKPLPLKSIYSQAVKDKRINNSEAKIVFKILADIEGSKIDYSKLVYRSRYNKYFDFARFGSLSRFYLSLMNNRIGINLAKVNIKEF